MNIIYSDTEIIVVEKPGGLLSVPGRGEDKQDCVVNRIRQLFSPCIDQPAVHRLDMHTSGIMVLARTSESHRDLSSQFEKRQIQKHYIALVDGIVTENHGRIGLKFRLDINNRPYQIYDPHHGKLGITMWKKLRVEGSYTRIEFAPLTGRTHQLRVHAAHRLGLNAPIVGDKLYGNGTEGDRMMLHATSLTFRLPQTGKSVTFASPAPF